MRHLRAILSAVLALFVVALITYTMARDVQFPIPEPERGQTVQLLDDPCGNVEHLREQLAREIDIAAECKTDQDCVPVLIASGYTTYLLTLGYYDSKSVGRFRSCANDIIFDKIARSLKCMCATV